MKKILVIEDDRNIVMALTVRLRSQGYEVAAAYDAIAGVAEAGRTRPDLILLDISMPGGNGLMVAERIRNLAPVAATPIIFLTASAKPELRAKAVELGAADFFEKPYDADALLASIRLVFGESASDTGARPKLRVA